MRKAFFSFVLLGLAVLACVRSQPQVIVITSTPEGITGNPTSVVVPVGTPVVLMDLSAVPNQAQIVPTANPTRSTDINAPREYIVQTGDTLYGIAQANGTSLETLLTLNKLPNPDQLSVGQVILLPGAPTQQTDAFKILPDSRLVRGPGSTLFDVGTFINGQSGYIRNAVDIVNKESLTASQVVSRVSLEYSVDARLLLTLLEYRARWLSSSNLSDTAKTYPMEGQPSPTGFDRSGLYKQLAWAANILNSGYYGWKYRGVTTLEFAGGERYLYQTGLNAATVGVQYFLSQNNRPEVWAQQIREDGFYRTYFAYFGDPFASGVNRVVPSGIVQPTLTLPFAPGETWFFTGGPHGGWGSGSAWAAVDFAPPDERPDGSPLCYISDFWATAVAPGVIARSQEGTVILDIDGDGDETTGWTIMYLHMATDGRVQVGTTVQAGDKIGHPSCEGGFSNATHMHIARRYSGEWLPVTCDQCAVGDEIPPLVLGGWSFVGLTNQEYQGYMVNGGERRNAEQGRLAPDNRVMW
jgi:murein DD-endopeptidase MepM/ murein hydrolase activator NlpD